MRETQRKEDMSISYISALCAYAGIAYEIIRHDDDSTDGVLRKKNYNDLCLLSTTPVMLGLLILPEDESAWLLWSREELLLRGCMYWAEFSGREGSENTGTVSVTIDKRNVVNAESLCQILEKIAKEEWP